jgi:phenylacetic acid degradation operon negative regulatory protein
VEPDPALGPASARSLLIAVLTLHVVPQGGTSWTTPLVEALALLGVNEKAARQALQRIAADGWLQTERVGRHARIHLTPHAHEEMQRQHHIARFEAATEPGEWIVMVLAPERVDPEQRRRLRRGLVSFGWGGMAPGVWLNRGTTSRDAALELLRHEGLEPSAAFLRGEPLASAAVDALIGRTWDLRALAGRYERFLERFASLAPRTDADAFVARTALTDTWIRTFRADPFLPDAYLPPDWPGTSARALIDDRMARWAPAADRWWAAATARCAPA